MTVFSRIEESVYDVRARVNHPTIGLTSARMSTASTSHIAPGALVGERYEVVRLIGKGGMGEVYEATNINSGRSVALKTIRAEIDQSPEQRRRFLREAKAATAIDHPNVIEVLDVFEEADGTLVMVMELLRGETLKEHRHKRGALTLHETAALMLPVVEALHTAHAKGIVHRDLKPENVFLAESHGGTTVPRLLDFGIAKVLDPATLDSETHGGGTATGSLLGTPHYMSYEQAMSEKDIDQRSDVWSLGVMVFEALTGRRPIEFENLGEMYTKFLTGSVPSIRELVSDVPDDFADVLDGCLALQRDDRLGDLGPLLEVLERYVDPSVEGAQAGGRVVSGAAVTADRVSTLRATSASLDGAQTHGGWRRLALGAAGVLLVAGLGGYLASRAISAPEGGRVPLVSSAGAPTPPSAALGPPGHGAASATVSPAPSASVATRPTDSAGARPPTPHAGRVTPLPRASAALPAAEPPQPPASAERRTGLAEEDPY